MRDLNEFRFSGTVQRFDRIQTNTGTAMVSFSVMCWKERIRTIAFKALADQTELSPGDWVEVRGHIQSTSWTDKHGQLRTGWQCIGPTASSRISYHREQARRQDSSRVVSQTLASCSNTLMGHSDDTNTANTPIFARSEPGSDDR